ELGVAVVGLAVRERQLHRLDDGVDVGGAVATEGGEMEVREQTKRLKQHRALRPRTRLEERRALELARDGLLELSGKRGPVLRIEHGHVASALEVTDRPPAKPSRRGLGDEA